MIRALLLSMTTSSNNTEVKTSLLYIYNIFTKDIAIVSHTIAFVNVPSPVECFLHCAKVCGCVAFQLTGTSCELLDTDKDDADWDLMTREGTFLYTMQGTGIEVRSWTIVSSNQGKNCYSERLCVKKSITNQSTSGWFLMILSPSFSTILLILINLPTSFLVYPVKATS